jgi:polyhydroxyalkanoate synthesis repressor PhaR
MGDERIIKKYANRRLYDTSESRYVALDDIRQLVLHGEPIRVIDVTTEEDISRSILLQIIVEQEEKGPPIFSTRLLQQIIHYYGDTLQAFVSMYLEKSMDTFTAQQQVFHDQLANLLRSAPQSVLTEITERNLALWTQMQDTLLKPYSSKSGSDSSSPRSDRKSVKKRG